jgi:hypothetical protein
MARWVLTVVTRQKDYLHVAYDTEDEAKAEQSALLEKLNSMGIGQSHVLVGSHTIRPEDITRTMVSTEGEAPGYGGVSFA